MPVQVVEQQRWEYRTKEETWSVLVTQDSVILQTTSYERFEGFADRLRHAVQTVLAKTENDQLGVVQRVGLRYVDVVQPRDGEDFRFYLRPGLHGVADEVFQSDTHRLHVESTGKTTVGNVDGTMVVRVVQNDQGFSLPPDLLGAAPKHTPRAKSGELITLVDMDHYIEGTFDPDAGWIMASAYEIHDHLIETLHKHVVTEEAIEVWK
ncbi:MAG: TIGR04255 family protein [Myxococcota bacterium]